MGTSFMTFNEGGMTTSRRASVTTQHGGCRPNWDCADAATLNVKPAWATTQI